MLVIFMSEAHENITMFGDVAKQLIKIMGYNSVEYGEIPAEEIPQVLARLKDAIESQKSNPTPQPNQNDDNEPPVSLAHRALPLIEMLKTAAKDKSSVTWKVR